MQIDSGLLPHMVLQRRRGGSNARIEGVCEHDGPVTVRVTQRDKAVRGFAGKRIGNAKRGVFTATLKGVPAGGPYRIELRAGREAVTVDDVLVGDVWIAAGQSNMQGCGMRGAAKPQRMVRAFYADDVWKTAKDPIHNLWHAVDPVHAELGAATEPNTISGVGPAVTFAQDMHARTGVPQGIIACAHGGTSMSQWDPKLITPSGSTLYRASIRRAMKNGGKVAGIIWYQGESDASGDAPRHYTRRMAGLVRAFRRDLQLPALPWVVVQIGRVIGPGHDIAGWNSVQDQQRLLPKRITHLAVVSAIDLALDDAIHISTVDQQRLGRRLAYAMDVLMHGSRAGKPPLALRGISVSQCHPTNGGHQITLQYDNVVGSLRAGSRPTGFAVVDADAEPVIYNLRTDGNKVHVLTTQTRGSLAARRIAYGYGTDPICNITDEADRSLPAMAPQPISTPRARTGLAVVARVAMPIELPPGVDGKLNGLKLPRGKRLDALPWRKRTFPGMCDMHLDIQKQKPRDYVVYFRFDVDVPEPMILLACLGYDGPVKLWLDGKEMYHDPDGTNPAMEDRAKVKWRTAKGRHQIVAALGSNVNRAWGIVLRLERDDITPAAVRRGGYLMPTFRHT